MHKFYKDAAGKVYAFESDGSQDAFITEDLIGITQADADAIRFPEPTSEQVIAHYTSVIQARLDDFAKTRGYDSALSAATYATSSNAKFAAEGQYIVSARDASWTAAYEQLLDYQSGGEQPSLESVLAGLPALAWPD